MILPADTAYGIDSCVGIDPGPATGMCFLDYDRGNLVGRTLLQADGGSAAIVLKAMLSAYAGTGRVERRVASVERFVTGQSAGARGKPAEVTRQIVFELVEVLQMYGYQVTLRNAGDVKPWATDRRLQAAGVTGTTRAMHGNMNHAYDAARHCLYGAKDAGVVADPLHSLCGARLGTASTQRNVH